LKNNGEEAFKVTRGMEIAQMIFMEHKYPIFKRVNGIEDLIKSKRGEGGFGSTNKSDQ